MKVKQIQRFLPLVLIVVALGMPSVIAHEHNTGPTWWNKECNNDWERSSAKLSCTKKEIKHVDLKDDYNICYVRAWCGVSRGHARNYMVVSEFTGRNVDVRNLSNCMGNLRVGLC